ncbi:MAG: 2-C-methyl-D-erythritol 4-phosphate cytidylyltransferase [Acidimicrobiales bacterium]
MAGSVWAVVVAAGQGSRFGGPKQFAMLGGRPVLELAVAAVAPACAGVVVVLPPHLVDRGDSLERLGITVAADQVHVVPGRESRSGSVRAGLDLVPEDCEVVVVHDAARPLASSRLCHELVAAVRGGADGAVPGLPVSDTVKRVERGEVVETLARDALVRVQTPQAFSSAMLRRAHAEDAEATDDAALVEAVGGRIAVIAGEDANLKITSREDLELAQWWYEKIR